MGFLITVLIVLALIVVVILVWRWAGWACPSWLVPLLENPYMEGVAGAKTLFERADVRPGMHVLDAGCGPGRLTVPASTHVGPDGRVVAVDVQQGMLDKLKDRIAQKGLTNVEIIHAGLGDGKLPTSEFDVAFLVTVLGEIPDKPAALREIHKALRPGGVLSITEVMPDPHYQRLSRVRAMIKDAGFRELSLVKGWVSYTLNAGKPSE